MLAWDFHMVFALEREWMQRLWFHYATNERLVFRFDDADAARGSHHQKFVVIDGEQAFLGGIDLCESRWDDRAHRSQNPLRRSRGRASKPYHDLQAHLVGPEAAGALRELFVDRWSRAAGDALDLEDQAPGPVGKRLPPVDAAGVRLGPGPVALSRTDCPADKRRVQEVEQLFVDAIAAAERLIYIETQYFSSTRICDALVERMRAPRAPAPGDRGRGQRARRGAEGRDRRGAAPGQEPGAAAAGGGETGHALGLYYSLSDGAGKDQRATYIHSKLLAVDDRFLTVGSANLTNRSMGVDSELHVSWEAPAGQTARSRGASAACASACWPNTPGCRGRRPSARWWPSPVWWTGSTPWPRGPAAACACTARPRRDRRPPCASSIRRTCPSILLPRRRRARRTDRRAGPQALAAATAAEFLRPRRRASGTG